MKRTSTSSIGALHPILFFMVVYGLSLFLAIFVCRTVYNTMNDESAGTSESLLPQTNTFASANATVLN
ncbi:MAG: hypothetical protein V4676_07610 [Bacteroidota bacterium]